MGQKALKLHFQGGKYCIFFSFMGLKGGAPLTAALIVLYLHFRIFYLFLCPSLVVERS